MVNELLSLLPVPLTKEYVIDCPVSAPIADSEPIVVFKVLFSATEEPVSAISFQLFNVRTVSTELAAEILPESSTALTVMACSLYGESAFIVIDVPDVTVSTNVAPSNT